jgi:hypothetical protein
MLFGLDPHCVSGAIWDRDRGVNHLGRQDQEKNCSGKSKSE